MLINVGMTRVATKRAAGETPYPPKDYYFTDFTGVADNTDLLTLAGWDAYNTTGIVTPDPTGTVANRWKVVSNRLTWVGAADFSTLPGGTFVGINAPASNLVFKFKLKALPSSGASLVIVLASTNVNNSMFVQCTNSSGTMQSVSLQKNIAGTVSSIGSLGGIGDIKLNDEVEFRVFGTKVWLYVNGIRITASAGVDIGSFSKGALVGFGTRNTAGAAFDDVYIAELGASVSVTDTQIFWAGLIGSGRSVPFAGTYSGTVSALDYRVVNSSTLAVVKYWARVSGATISGGVWSANLSVPMADTTTNPKFKLQVRAANDIDANTSGNNFTVGVCVGSYGQSNSAYRGQGSATSHAVAHGYAWSADNASVWLGGGTTSTIRSELLATQIAASIGIPVGVHVDGRASQSITNLIDQSAGMPWSDVLSRTALSKAYGYISAWLWTQGENEAGSSVAFDESAYRSNFDTLLGLLRGAISVNSDVSVGVVVIGRFTGTHVSGATFGNANWYATRRGLVNLADKTGVYVASNFVDTPMVDDYHYTANGYVENGRRSGLSMRKYMGYAPSGYNGRGSIITGATRSGATITLAVDLNGASSISGSGLTNYEVSTDDFATTKTISSVAVSGGNIVITLSADPSAAVKVRSFYGMTYGTPTFAIGNYADGTTIPVEPLYVAIESS